MAKNFYQQILAIDPEDTGSHYNLMLVYKKLGMRDDAAKEEKVFLDLKDDPRTTALAGDFLQRNPSVARRSMPYYVNDLQPFQRTWERQDAQALLGFED